MNNKKVICIGNGLAAIFFALLLDESIDLVWVMENSPEQSNSYLAKGGIAVSLTPEDQEKHIQDTLTAACGLADPIVVRSIIKNGPNLLAKLKSYGLLFDETKSKEGGHSTSRIEHISDQTGKFIVSHLWQLAKKRKNTQFLNHTVLLDILVDNHISKGVELVDKQTGEISIEESECIVLATGGIGNLFRVTSNGIGANGEGLSIAHKRGAEVKNAAFVQFHPTLLYQRNQGTPVLVTEAFRGDGAILKGMNGEDLMASVHPLGSLAPRDIVSLNLASYMAKSKSQFVWLDFNGLNQEKLEAKFPYLFRVAKIQESFSDYKIAVTPAAHYHCGGLQTDEKGMTNITGLFAIGELANTGLHGANRLASNSLLELLHVGEKLATHLNQVDFGAGKSVSIKKIMQLNESYHAAAALFQLKEIMWNNFGIKRTIKGMEKGYEQLHHLQHQLLTQNPGNLSIKRTISKIGAGLLVADAALELDNSIGCHFVE
ncbi:MAG: FAD-binding protein [Bacteroidia bacterium]|nr:FAD-binding protein [Bacteroidia bacterium]MCF8446328.1 FAD-binding protein [Bacteroidia bacterium]